jgi:hypothetical protein
MQIPPSEFMPESVRDAAQVHADVLQRQADDRAALAAAEAAWQQAAAAEREALIDAKMTGAVPDLKLTKRVAELAAARELAADGAAIADEAARRAEAAVRVAIAEHADEIVETAGRAAAEAGAALVGLLDQLRATSEAINVAAATSTFAMAGRVPALAHVRPVFNTSSPREIDLALAAVEAWASERVERARQPVTSDRTPGDVRMITSA